MTERILAPAAAAVAVAAAALAGGTIALLLTIPTGRAAAPLEGDLVPLVAEVLALIWDAIVRTLQYV